MIHRDLKPGNVMLTERHDDPYFVKVLDFGLVKVMGQEELKAELTQSGTLIGSPRYMAPEQVLRFELDHRVDVYSLGGVLYHALTGLPPFQHESQFQVLRAQVEEQPQPFAAVFPACEATPRLERLVMKCLEKERRERPSDMQEVADELIECAREIGVEEASLSGALRVWSSPSRELQRALLEGPSGHAEVETSEVRKADTDLDAPVTREAEAAEKAPSRSRPLAMWLLLGVLCSLAASGGIAGVIFFDDDPPPTALPAAAPEDTALTPPLRIETDPPGARVQRGEVDLGDAPFVLEIPDGERWELTVSLDGYASRTVLATPGREVLRVRLDELATIEPLAEPGTTRRRGARGGSGGRGQSRGEMRDPWAQ